MNIRKRLSSRIFGTCILRFRGKIIEKQSAFDFVEFDGLKHPYGYQSPSMAPRSAKGFGGDTPGRRAH